MPRDGLAWYGGRILVCEHNLLMAEACRFAALSPDCRNPTAGRPNYGRLGSGQSGGTTDGSANRIVDLGSVRRPRQVVACA